MPNDFDSSHPHVVVPVQHPNGQVDQIAVPTDTSLEDLYGALADAGYLHEFPTAQPTAAGALENSDDFRNQSKAAWDTVNKGGNPYAESGFSVYSDGGASSLHTEVHPQGGMVLWMVSPGDGKITQVFKSSTWFSDKVAK
jgi:hypothetical protein